ncbi:respiratory nitrate reductase gamma chain [Sulfuriferula multivorans]|uniref:nitrate reductase (quinone) n=1 Tax=Sulfuriferula multivorans TaxID=1559896 RepID=A0A401JBG3_9PROT|nr:respiratory nitrate reductase subunit gamma [Sulfuriferula multivorans]GBL44973.1 respiratory nitrate reductase gamma chain [Sulfuriferula multivorans]
MDYLNNLLFGIYPYVALAIFFLGSLIRFDREQYTWKSDSSQLLKRSQLRWGSNLFHIGILFLFFGHAVGLLTPHWLYESMGLTTEAKQLLAMISGGAAGLACLAGISLLLHRRLTEPRIRATSKPMDIIILLWVFVTLLLGLTTILFSAQHLDGADMLLLANWAQHIVTFRSGAAQFLLAVPLIFKIHLFFGMTLFLLFPFSRLVHVWSGFAAVAYLTRSYQVVRQRG